MGFSFSYPYNVAPEYKLKVAYFCMEYAIDQALKTYAGGLGFLAGSHMRSAYELKQHMVGIGILWKYGYYDQVRKEDQGMAVLFQEKIYGFLVNTDIRIPLEVNGHRVWATAYYLPPEVFGTAPVFFLSTDIPENDYEARTICHKLYNSNPETEIAAAILLGVGGARLLEILNWIPDIYHLNESHALPLAFSLYKQTQDIRALRRKLVFTNHTPEESGNRKTHVNLLNKMGFFCDLPIQVVQEITQNPGDILDYTISALRLSGKANGVSDLHYQSICRMWKTYPGICPFTFITNAQSFSYWADTEMYTALEQADDDRLIRRKKACKKALFAEVADQNGEIYNEDILTVVFAKRFGGYKRPGLLLDNMDRFHRLVTDPRRPIQIIWAGKPYPMDYTAIENFDKISRLCKRYPNCATLVGYELRLSRLLKQGADVWLNVPRITHEASGTSGMSAAMNGGINISIPDGWFPEFARDKINSFVIPASDPELPEHVQDEKDAQSLYDVLEQVVIPMYYDQKTEWLSIIKQGMRDIIPRFDSNRMAREYYERIYLAEE